MSITSSFTVNHMSLHLNELPMRHPCRKYIGPTESRTQWKGPLVTALTTCETLPVSPNGFQCIAKGAPLPDVDVNDLVGIKLKCIELAVLLEVV